MTMARREPRELLFPLARLRERVGDPNAVCIGRERVLVDKNSLSRLRFAQAPSPASGRGDRKSAPLPRPDTAR
jgi:hypothetical protein